MIYNFIIIINVPFIHLNNHMAVLHIILTPDFICYTNPIMKFNFIIRLDYNYNHTLHIINSSNYHTHIINCSKDFKIMSNPSLKV